MLEENERRRERIPKRELLQDTTPIPNVILDAWLPHLNPAETKVVFYVARRTRGWGRDWDRLSVKQIMTGIVRRDGRRLDGGTGLGMTACRGAVRSLVKRGALRREEAVSATGASEPPWYRLDLSWAPAHDSEDEDSVSKDVGVSESDRGRVSGSDRGEGVGNPTGEGVSLSDRGRVSESGGHKTTSPVSPPGGGDGVGGVSEPAPFSQKGGGGQKRTPPSSSSLGSVGDTHPGERDDARDDDGRNNDPENPDEGRDNGTRLNGGGSREEAARGSWQSLSDEIKAIPEEAITGEARELGDRLREKVPRVATARLERLALCAIETHTVPHLAAVVAGIEKKLKFDVDNAWSYLIKALWPLPDACENGKSPHESFGEAYGAAQPARTLGGVGRRHHFAAVENTQPRNLDGYFKPFIADDERDGDAAAEAFGDAYEASRPTRTLRGKASRDGFTGVGGRRPHKTEDYIERL